ncbi:type II secretion system F family protein [Paenibacillus alkalitolerans]|uniref:type II secretion system F family protein n=1 Tax=Paenibacillus alkalitolerans TaxID=2799335 RepID=UPI0018F2C572|nr:type II secretion system F family protein [Paenibacillus alkalitolerans]
MRGSNQYGGTVARHIRSPVGRNVIIAGMELNRMVRVMEWIAQYAPGIVRSAALIYGSIDDRTDDIPRIWAAKATSSLGCGILCSLLAAAIFQDAAIAGVGLAISCLAPFVMWRDLDRKVKERHRAFVTELPVFVHKMSLLIGAGEPVQGAWIRASVPSTKDESHPLYRELGRMRNEIAQSVSFAKALELFSQRCGIPETSFLVTTTLMNYRRGGDTFALILQQTGRTMIEKKRAVLKTMGEEATTKMVFPMVIIFATMMAIVAAPAIMLLNQGL